MSDTTWAREYWDRRHAAQDELRAGGNVGMDRVSNEIFYARRIARILEAVGDRSSSHLARRALDAGCGRGIFTRAFRRFGWHVDAFDASPVAIAHAEEGGGRYHISAIHEWVSARPYDVVLCIDVLFHILDDDEWRRSLRSLADHVGLGGQLLITELPVTERTPLGRHIIHRPLKRALELLEPAGLRREQSLAYGFRDNDIEFHVMRRVA